MSRVLVLFGLAVTLSSCSVWDSLTAYFNTYYNAERLFTEAEEEIWTQPAVKFSGRDYLAPVMATPGAKTKLTSVIEKCSKLLADNSESGLVDNCLLYIGKSFFYQGEYQRAERKFLELLEGYPESDLVPEARMMLAYSFYKAGDREGAQRASEAMTALAAEIEEEWLAGRAAAIQGQLAIDREDYEQATRHILVAVEDEPVREQRVTLYLKLAELYEKLGDPRRALEAYNEASSLSTDFVGEYKGMIGSARMMTALGEYDDALDRLDDLRSNSNFREYFGEIDFAIGSVYRLSGDLDEALQQYQYVDTAYARTEASAKAVFELGRLYEEEFGELDSARVTYTRGRTAFPQAEISKEIIRRADYMNRYAALRTDIAKYDSLLSALDAPPQEPPATADSTSKDSLATPVVQPPLSRDTLQVRLATAMNEMAGVFFIDMNLPDSAAIWYRAVAERYPESNVAPYAMFALSQIYDQDSTVDESVPDSIRQEIVRRFPRTEFARESRRLLGLPAVTIAANPAEELYEVAEQRYLAGEYESAARTFRELATEYPDSRYAARAEYAAGYIYENYLLMPDSALASYRNLLDNYPSSAFIPRVQPKVRVADMEAKRIADSLAALTAPDSLAPVMPDSTVVADSLGGGVRDSLQAAPAVPDSLPREPGAKEEGSDMELPGRPKP